MFRFVFALCLTLYGCAMLATAATTALAPFFGFAAGPATFSMTAAATGAGLLAAGWAFTAKPRPHPLFPAALFVTLLGLGLSLGPLRGNAWSTLSARNWGAVGVGTVACLAGLWLLPRTRRDRAA